MDKSKNSNDEYLKIIAEKAECAQNARDYSQHYKSTDNNNFNGYTTDDIDLIKKIINIIGSCSPDDKDTIRSCIDGLTPDTGEK